MKISIQKTTLFWVILIFPFMRPNGISGINSLISRAYYIAMYLSFVILFLLYIREKRSDLKFLITAVCLVSWIILITIINQGLVSTIVRVAISIIGVILCVEIMCKDPKKMFVAFLTNFEIVIYINFICLLIYPSGMYVTETGTQNWANWFLGYKNHWFIVFFVAFYVAIMYAKLGGSLIRTGLLIVIIHISMFMALSGAVLVGVILMDILFLFRIYKLKIFNLYTVIATSVITFIALMFMSNTLVIRLFIDSFMQKENSLSARISIWNNTINYIAKKPILGYGRTDLQFRQLVMYHNYHGVNAHNMWLEILFLGGIIAFSLFIILIFLMGRKIVRNKNAVSTKLWLVCFLACIVTLNVDSAFEIRGAMFFFLLAVGNRIESLVNEELYLNDT